MFIPLNRVDKHNGYTHTLAVINKKNNMSFLVIEVVSKGIIFAADRNVTTTYSDGSENQNKKIEKVIKWPNNKAIIGFVGQAQIGGEVANDWCNKFINDNLDFISLEDVSERLRSKVENQRKIDDVSDNPQPLIIHLGGFEVENSVKIPKIFLITNVWDLKKGKYCDFRKEFKSTEEFWNYFPNISHSEIKQTIEKREKHFEPFWFHQGFDLITFNVLHLFIKNAFKVLITEHPEHKFPSNIKEWEKHVKMQILMYGSYFESFGQQNQQYVGGGSDIISIEW